MAQRARTNPNALERVSKAIAQARRYGTVAKLRGFRESFATDMDGCDWMMFQGPFILFMADLCHSLNLTDQERAQVLGLDGERVLAAFLNCRFTVVEHEEK